MQPAKVDNRNVNQFIPKAERERLRLIREARAIYDSVFPSEVIGGRSDGASAIDARRGDIRARRRAIAD